MTAYGDYPESDAPQHEIIRQTLEQGSWNGEVVNTTDHGDRIILNLRTSLVRDSDRTPLAMVGISTDITDRKNHQRQLEHIAHYDCLTNLPNRLLLADRMRQAMAQELRYHHQMAVVYIDIDGFKAVNDTHGHDMGDRLLQCLSERMKRALREGDTLARIGGDEFIAVLLDLTEEDACPMILERLLEQASHPITLDGHPLQVSASMGVTFFPQPGDIDADHLIRQADQAMYQAKQTGKNRYQIFDIENS